MTWARQRRVRASARVCVSLAVCACMSRSSAAFYLTHFIRYCSAITIRNCCTRSTCCLCCDRSVCVRASALTAGSCAPSMHNTPNLFTRINKTHSTSFNLSDGVSHVFVKITCQAIKMWIGMELSFLLRLRALPPALRGLSFYAPNSFPSKWQLFIALISARSVDLYAHALSLSTWDQMSTPNRN